MKNKPLNLPLTLAFLTSLTASLFAQGTAFTYQGRLNSGGAPANGLYDFRFKLYSDPIGNAQVGASYLTNGIPATNGLFTTTIDFGAGIFTGGSNWLEIDVRTNNSANYTMLNPLQALTPAPSAIFAETAGNVSGIVPAAQIGGPILNAQLPASPSFSGAVAANAFSGNGANVTNVNAALLSGKSAANFWQTAGNAGLSPATGNFLGTADNQPLELRANNSRALRIEPATNGSPNLIAGSPVNFASPGVFGATISGGGIAYYAEFLAGYTNIVTGSFGTVSGGFGNSSGYGSVVGGGVNNVAGEIYAFVGGGFANIASGGNSTIAGGEDNFAYGLGSFVGGGGYDGFNYTGNSAYGNASVIGGGIDNVAYGWYSTIVGGCSNQISFSGYEFQFIGGGENNIASGQYATLAGGQNDIAVGGNSFVGGGYGNSASNAFDTVTGGQFNNAAGGYSFVGSGYANAALGANSFIGGGYVNDASGSDATIGGGYENVASGMYATVPGGYKNYATGQYSFAAGEYADADNNGTFVWSDTSGGGDLFASTAANQFLIHAAGGVGIGTNSPNASLEVASTYNPQLRLDNQANDYARVRFAGYTNATWDIAGLKSLNFFCSSYGNVLVLNNNGSASLSGTLSQGSDRNIKQDFAPINSADMLAKVVGLPISQWVYKADAQTRHIGPMSQDFYAAFAVGPDDKHITTVDEGGVALAAIQGLNEKLEAQKAENANLKQQLAELKAFVQHLAQQGK